MYRDSGAYDCHWDHSDCSHLLSGGTVINTGKCLSVSSDIDDGLHRDDNHY